MNIQFMRELKARVVILNDTDLSDDLVWSEIVPLLKYSGQCQVVNADECSLGLAEFWSALPDSQTMYVFPGRGATDVRIRLDLLDVPFQPDLQVRASRSWTASQKPEVKVDWPATEVNHLITDVVVIDDVVSSGETMIQVKKHASGNLKEKRWHLLTWVAKSNSLLRLKNEFINQFMVYKVDGIEGDLAINSLSTLLSNETIRQRFAKRRAVNTKQFCEKLLIY